MMPSSRIFEAIHSGLTQLSCELEKYVLRNVLVVNQAETVVLLTDNYLVLCDNVASPYATHYCRLGFDVKFYVIYQKLVKDTDSLGVPIGIRLERENTSDTVLITSTIGGLIEVWSIELEKKINQRNFHKLFKAKKKIGKGAFATVYLAERLRDGKMVAVKAFSKYKQYAGDKGKESLENEIKLMRRISHSNIMRLEGVYETDNSIYAILEYLEGAQLNDLLKSGKKLSNYEVLSTMQNILRGLSHLAKNRVIHRDLKPYNIMFRKEGSFDLAICDFGLATHADYEKYLFVRCGTPGFVAPEIINIRDMSVRCDPISDVFSAGIIFHYLLFGCSVFEGKKYQEILNQNRSCEFNFNKDCYRLLSEKNGSLLLKMLEKDPLKRITAEYALKHPYFTDEMETEEYENKLLFREIGNHSSYSHSLKMYCYDTPSSLGRKKYTHKLSFYEPRKENVRKIL